MARNDFDVLHVYGQAVWHDDVVIAGTRGALEALRRLLDAALAHGTSTEQAFTGDGEGYDVRVFRVESRVADLLATPYTEELAAGARAAAIHPWQLADGIGKEPKT